MIGLLRSLADVRKRHSLASRLRRKRFQLFKKFASSVDSRPLTILDVGGTLDFWKRMGFLAESAGFQLTLLNLFRAESPYPNVVSVVGDGRNMSGFRDGQFDVVFSNSVIEHVGNLADQKRMADEIRRIGNAYFLQTPNFHFPIEPHFLFPFFQFLPLALKALLLKHFRIGWHGPTGDLGRAKRTISSVRLLRRSELARLFPDGKMYEERVLGLTKSFVVFRPWSAERKKAARQPCAPQAPGAPCDRRSRSEKCFLNPDTDPHRRSSPCGWR